MDEEQVALQLQAIREQAVSIGRACNALVKQVDAILGKHAMDPAPPAPQYFGAEDGGSNP